MGVESVEVGGVWVVACAEKVKAPNKPQQQHVKLATKVQNKFQSLSDDDDEDECNDCMSWPVVGKGGKVNKAVEGDFEKGKTSKVQKV